MHLIAEYWATAETPLFKLFLALALGALIGAEREYKSKVAGFRTIILITVGSTLFTLISQSFPNDPSRIAANIVTGIGFLGAGVIFRDGGTIRGITTAAVIWVAAAIGMGVGLGLYVLSAVSVIVVMLVLLAFSWLQKIIDRSNRERVYRVHMHNHFEHTIIIKQMVKSYGLSSTTIHQGKKGTDMFLVMEVEGPVKNHGLFMKALYESTIVDSFEV